MPNITKTYEASPLGVLGYVCEECDKKYVSVVRDMTDAKIYLTAKSKMEHLEKWRIATQRESQRRRRVETKALAVVQEEDRAKAEHRAKAESAPKRKKPAVAQPPKPAEE
jgi:hypothetical protein